MVHVYIRLASGHTLDIRLGQDLWLDEMAVLFSYMGKDVRRIIARAHAWPDMWGMVQVGP